MAPFFYSAEELTFHCLLTKEKVSLEISASEISDPWGATLFFFLSHFLAVNLCLIVCLWLLSSVHKFPKKKKCWVKPPTAPLAVLLCIYSPPNWGRSGRYIIPDYSFSLCKSPPTSLLGVIIEGWTLFCIPSEVCGDFLGGRRRMTERDTRSGPLVLLILYENWYKFDVTSVQCRIVNIHSDDPEVVSSLNHRLGHEFNISNTSLY